MEWLNNQIPGQSSIHRGFKNYNHPGRTLFSSLCATHKLEVYEEWVWNKIKLSNKKPSTEKCAQPSNSLGKQIFMTDKLC